MFSQTKVRCLGFKKRGQGRDTLCSDREFRPVPNAVCAEPRPSLQLLPDSPQSHSLSFGAVADTTAVAGHDETSLPGSAARLLPEFEAGAAGSRITHDI